MKKYLIRQYKETDYLVWNTFIGRAVNSTFLFHRDFMEYHSDRFKDFSVMVYDSQELVAVLPANISEGKLISHAGLTYGGLVYATDMRLPEVIDILRALLLYINQNNIAQLYIKTIPSIYHKKPAEELLYALFLANAELVRRDTLSVIDLAEPVRFSKLRVRGIAKANRHKLVAREATEETEFEEFWNEILTPNLFARHGVKPVHNLGEIIYLKGKFSQNIRQFNVYNDHEIVAGATVFESDTVAHCQYISKYKDEKSDGGLDLLFSTLIREIFAKKKYFDFGISNELEGRRLNRGLNEWKRSFGASIIVQDAYIIETKNHELLSAYT